MLHLIHDELFKIILKSHLWPIVSAAEKEVFSLSNTETTKAFVYEEEVVNIEPNYIWIFI